MYFGRGIDDFDMVIMNKYRNEVIENIENEKMQKMKKYKYIQNELL